MIGGCQPLYVTSSYMDHKSLEKEELPLRLTQEYNMCGHS